MIWIVVPTFNESANLERLLADIFEMQNVHVLIVDDNSPDGTGQLAESLRSRWNRLSVLHRPQKTGLSDAYREGLQYALDHSATSVVHLDADGSHDPHTIPQLISGLENHDVVIGSRYVPGGILEIPWQRKWISLIGNGYLRWMLGFELHDWSSGFKAWRGPMLQRVLREPWPTKGYACLLIMSWLAKRAGARFFEQPIRFVDRTQGDSKFSLGIMLEDLAIAWKVRRSGLAK